MTREDDKKVDVQLMEVLVKTLTNDPNITKDFETKLEFGDQRPQCELLLGDVSGLNEAKMRITPEIYKWEHRAKFLVSPYELIDIDRVPEICDRKFNRPIVRYDRNFQPNDSRRLQDIYSVFSRAYFKLWEVLSESQVLEPYRNKILRVGNIAEGPGGFIHCLIDFRAQQKNKGDWKEDSYFAITLNVTQLGSNAALDWNFHKAKKYFDLLRKNRYKVELSYGAGDGDLYKLENIDHFKNENLKGNKCELVTADGGLDLKSDEEFSAQEMANLKLFFAEIVTCFSIQEKGGVFIMKIYDIYSSVTVQLIALLQAHYKKISIIKPHTSRLANSERYLICEGFLGIAPEKLEQLRQALASWAEKENDRNYLENSQFLVNLINYPLSAESPLVKDLFDFNKYTNDIQKNAIEEGLELISSNKINDEELIREYKMKQRKLAKMWCDKNKIPCHVNLKLSKLKVLGLEKNRNEELVDQAAP